MCRFTKRVYIFARVTCRKKYLKLLIKNKLFHVMIIDELTYITIVTRCLDFITVLWMGNAR